MRTEVFFASRTTISRFSFTHWRINTRCALHIATIIWFAGASSLSQSIFIEASRTDLGARFFRKIADGFTWTIWTANTTNTDWLLATGNRTFCSCTYVWLAHVNIASPCIHLIPSRTVSSKLHMPTLRWTDRTTLALDGDRLVTHWTKTVDIRAIHWLAFAHWTAQEVFNKTTRTRQAARLEDRAFRFAYGYSGTRWGKAAHNSQFTCFKSITLSIVFACVGTEWFACGSINHAFLEVTANKVWTWIFIALTEIWKTNHSLTGFGFEAIWTMLVTNKVA